MQMRYRTLLFAVAALWTAALAAAERPNILWISCEDISPHLGCYGDPLAITPHLDRLAEEGVRYSHAFTAAGVCAPNRSTIITGMYQTTIGTHHMRCNAVLPDSVRPFPLYLREAGYYCTNRSKKDYQFKDPKETWDESGGKAHWKNREKGQPFFAVFNFTGCHESGIAGASKYESVTKDLAAAERQHPEKLKETLPPYYPATPVVLEDWKRNYELITAMDHWAAGLIRELKDEGLYEDTIIMFWSDHGVGLPRAKRWLYDSGTHVPLIVRVPEKYRTGDQATPGTVSAELISSLDLGPTVLNLAGLAVPEVVQGRAFLGENLSAPRDYVYGARDRMDERYDIIRTVRDQRYRYLRNYEPLKPYYQYMNTPEKGATMRELRTEHAEGKLPEAAELFMADRKPVEELYDLEEDPYEVNNLAGDPAHAGRLAAMREVHAAWVRETRDIGLIPEPEIELREKAAGSRHAILADSGDETLPARLGKVAAQASEGVVALPALLRAMSDPDAAVRYWAATGLGNLGAEAKETGMKPVRDALGDESAVVRVAAARALIRMGDAEAALPVLEAELSGPEQWTRLHAAIVLDEAGESARSAIPALEKALVNQPNKYIVRVANRALNDLKGTENAVP